MIYNKRGIHFARKLRKNCALTSHLLLTYFPKPAHLLLICFSPAYPAGRLASQKLRSCFSPALLHHPLTRPEIDLRPCEMILYLFTSVG